MRIPLIAAGALVLAGLPALAAAPANAAEHDPAPVAAAADWLTGELTGGLIVNEQFAFSDVGLTIDAALGLDAVGGRDETVQTITDAVEGEITSYVGNGTTESYAGALAKAVVLTELPAAGANPRNFGGVDLVDRLEERIDVTGRISDKSEFGDFANVIGQTFAVRALDGVNSGETDAATDHLLSQQCPAGFFRQSFGTAADCGADDASVDTTALAVLALQSQLDDTDVAPLVAAAVEWLAGQQRDGGSLPAGGEISTPNANSTGLAGWALGISGETVAAERAAAWIRGHQTQNVGPCAPYAVPDLGAVAYDNRALAAVADTPVGSETSDQFRRATAQALPALQWAPLAVGPPNVLAPAGYVKAGTKTTVGVANAAPGEAICAQLKNTNAQRATNVFGEVSIPVKLPPGTGARAVSVLDADGLLGEFNIMALGKLKVPFTLDGRVAQGDKQVVKVTGLAPGEIVSVVVDGKSVDFGQAADNGKFTGRFTVKSKPGLETVKVVGQFPNRKNSKTFQVIAATR